MLVDLGVTHSFVSLVFASMFNRSFIALEYLLLVATPLNDAIIVAIVFPGCLVRVDGKDLSIDLIPLLMMDFDVT